MPILDVTYHSADGIDPLRRAMADVPIGILPEQLGDSQQLDFTSGVVPGAAQSNGALARFVTDADCRVAVGVGVAATVANSAKYLAGVEYYLFIPAGARLSVRAA